MSHQKYLKVLESHKLIVFKVCKLYCQDEEDRKDLAQEIVGQLWKSFHKYNEQYQYSTWIYRISMNVAISFYRKEKRRKTVSTSLSDSILNFADTQLSEETERDLGLLQQFISELKTLDKALMLLYLEEKSYHEISEILGITETNVATKIGRVKAALKQKFSRI